MPDSKTKRKGVFSIIYNLSDRHLDLMIAGKKPNHSNHDQPLTTLLETARRCNVRLNYEKLQYKREEVDFLGETYTTSGCKPDKNKVTAITKMPAPTNKYNNLKE